MTELSIWLDSHCPPRDLGVFKSVAELRDAGVTDTIYSVSDGEELIDVILAQPRRSVDRVVIAGHGGTSWLLDDLYGVTTAEPRHRGQVSIWQFGRALALALRVDGEQIPFVCLAACLTARSPAWYLRTRLGRHIGSDWGPRGYRPGGQYSFMWWLHNVLHYFGVSAELRGHLGSGHATGLSLLARQIGTPPCLNETLFSICFPKLEPTLMMRRWWTKNVTGLLAQRWLMRDDDVVDDILALRI